MSAPIRANDVATFLLLVADAFQVWVLEPDKIEPLLEAAIPEAEHSVAPSQLLALEGLSDSLVAAQVAIDAQVGGAAEAALDRLVMAVGNQDRRIATELGRLLDEARTRAGA